MTATAIKPGLPVVAAPPIYAVLDYGPTHNAREAAIFKAEGPVGLLRRLGLPALLAGARAVIVRMIPSPDWTWLLSWDEAAVNLGVPLILYLNPTGWNSTLAERVRGLGRKIALEFTGQHTAVSWVRGYLGSLLWAVEPCIEVTDLWAVGANKPMILNDHDWDNGHKQPDGWYNWQVKPERYAGGVIRWYQGGTTGIKAWYTQQAQPWCKGVIVPAEYTPGLLGVSP